MRLSIFASSTNNPSLVQRPSVGSRPAGTPDAPDSAVQSSINQMLAE